MVNKPSGMLALFSNLLFVLSQWATCGSYRKDRWFYCVFIGHVAVHYYCFYFMNLPLKLVNVATWSRTLHWLRPAYQSNNVIVIWSLGTEVSIERRSSYSELLSMCKYFWAPDLLFACFHSQLCWQECYG